jgi:hypothetical protein
MNLMRKRTLQEENVVIKNVCLGAIAFFILFCFSFLLRTNAQEKEPSARGSAVDSTEILRGILEERRAEYSRLERMLEALNAIDSVYRVRYPTWMVQDEDLKQRIYKSFRVHRKDVVQEAPVLVVANQDFSDILQLSVGRAVMGRREVRMNLSDSLYTAILSGDYTLRWIDPAAPPRGRSMLFSGWPKKASAVASAYGASVKFAGGWGVEGIIGHDEIGYPFWLTGSGRAMVIYDRLKIGVMVPFKFGRKQPDILEPLAIRPRRLNGSTGMSLEYEQPFDKHIFTARVTVGELNKFVAGQLTDESRPYYLHTIAQLLYSRHFELGSDQNLLDVTGGFGYHQIARGEVKPDKKIVATEKINFASPLLRAEYTRHAEKMYGLSLQYYGSVVLITGWVEVIKNFVYLDLRYSTVIIRKPKAWEQPYFVMVSPKFRVAF